MSYCNMVFTRVIYVTLMATDNVHYRQYGSVAWHYGVIQNTFYKVCRVLFQTHPSSPKVYKKMTYVLSWYYALPPRCSGH